MWSHGPRQKLRMELTPHHKRMIFNLGDFNQLSIGGNAREGHACFFEFIAEGIIELKAVTMALLHFFFAVCRRGFGTLLAVRMDTVRAAWFRPYR